MVTCSQSRGLVGGPGISLENQSWPPVSVWACCPVPAAPLDRDSLRLPWETPTNSGKLPGAWSWAGPPVDGPRQDGVGARGWTCVAKVWHLFSVQTQRLSRAVLLPCMMFTAPEISGMRKAQASPHGVPPRLYFSFPRFPARLVSLCCCGPSRPLTHGLASEFLGHKLGFVSFPEQRD